MEIRYALRSLRKSPAFAIIATLTLAMGIALTTTTYSLIDTVKHPYVPFREPERLFRILPWGIPPSGQQLFAEKNRAVVEGSKSFDIASASSVYGTIRTEAIDVEAYGSAVSSNFFDLYGLKPVLGRTFGYGPSGAEEGNAVISYGFWQNGFASKPVESGLQFQAGDRRYTVIGVMSPGMEAPLGRTFYWIRLPGGPGTDLGRGNLIVRLKPGFTYEQGQADLAVIARQLTQTFGEGRQPFSFQLYPYAPPPGVLTDSQKALAGATVAILLIACVNLANLMLARAINRRRELAVRLALGATRQGLVRYVLAEAMVIAVAGGALGTMFAISAVGLLRSRVPGLIADFGQMAPHLSWRVYAFALGASVVSALVFGLAPALRASDIDLNEPLKDGAGTTGRRKYRYSGLVIAEVALCLTLLMWAGLTLRSLKRLAVFDFGYDAGRVLTGFKSISNRVAAGDSALIEAYDSFLKKVRNVPGVVEAATYTSSMPGGAALTSDLEGGEPLFDISLSYLTVSSAYFRAMGIPIVLGRDFEPGDERASPVAIIDEAAARKLWPGVDPIGHLVKLGGPDTQAPWYRIVGVSKAVNLAVGIDPESKAYVVNPSLRARNRQLAIRVAGDSARVRELSREVGLAAYGSRMEMRTMQDALTGTLQSRGFMVKVFATLSGLALFLTAVGLYGVLSYAVSRRMREFALRMALGAERGTLLKLVFRDGAVMVLAGTAIGAWLAMWAAKFLESWLDSVPRTDAVALIVAELILVGVSLAACWVPAVRATRADPMEVIRAI